MTATPPGDWTVTFEPETTETLAAAGQVTNVTAHITPTGDAIAGDYTIGFRAASEESDDDSATSGSPSRHRSSAPSSARGLVAAALGGLYWVFRRYGRR